MNRLRRPLHTTRGRLLIVALVVLLVALAAVQLAPRPAPQVADPSLRPSPATSLEPTGEPALARPDIPLLVSAARAGDTERGTAATVGRPLTISAHALGRAGVAALELWDGERPLAFQEAPADSSSPAFYARWSWTPETAGEHILLVRAIDRLGRVVQSDALRIGVGPSILAANGTIQPLADRSASYGIFRPALGATHLYAMAAPELSAQLVDCQLQLSTTGAGGAGVALHGLAPDAFSFEPLALRGPKADGDSFDVIFGGGGLFAFSASLFDGLSEVFSPPVTVDIPPSCATDGWSGDIALVGGKVKLSPPPDRAYLYLSHDDGGGVRAPVAPLFVEPGGEGWFDFTPHMPELDDRPLNVEAWGWRDGALVHLGNGRYVPPPPPSGGSGSTGDAIAFGGGLQLAGGLYASLHIVEQVTIAGPVPCGAEFCVVDELLLADDIHQNSTKRTLRWTTLSPANVDHFVWQVLPYTPPDAADLAPPFMIDYGTLPVAPGQTTGDFEIDFAKYLTNGVPAVDSSVSLADTLVLDSSLLWAVNTGTGGGPTPTPAGGSTWVQGGGLGQMVVGDAVAGPIAPFSGRFYVRLVPVQDKQAAKPSNHVTLDLVEVPPPQIVAAPGTGPGLNQNAYTINWAVNLPKAADPKYARCAIVTGFASDYKAQFNPYHSGHQSSYNNQTPICYKPPSSSGWSLLDVFEAIVEFVADVWDYIADGYQWIQDKVVAAIAAPCKAIGGSDAVCKTIGQAAWTALTSSVGIPPTLPDFETVVAGLKGDLQTLIVNSASALPGVAEVCGLADTANVVTAKVKSCEELVGKALDEAVKQIQAARSEAAGKSTGMFWPGVEFRPDPRGQYHYPEFVMTIERTSDPVLPNVCTLAGYMESARSNWTWKEPAKYPLTAAGMATIQVTGDVKGEPFLPASLVIPPLAPGEAITRQLWLTEPTQWWETIKARDVYFGQTYKPPHTWVLLNMGNELTFRLTGNCSKPAQQGPFVLPHSAAGG